MKGEFTISLAQDINIRPMPYKEHVYSFNIQRHALELFR